MSLEEISGQRKMDNVCSHFYVECNGAKFTEGVEWWLQILGQKLKIFG